MDAKHTGWKVNEKQDIHMLLEYQLIHDMQVKEGKLELYYWRIWL